ncbi:MAG: NAD(P)/FAD-dependent oxidoreductase [Betaproteobacteria bacterium]|nr:NAD(P)/FAD-dependent oxidoreductase [Betaproteobacteria bacterium]
MTSLTRPRVLIIGGGFGGIEAAKSLAKSPVDITLVDKTNHHLFQPLLYQVATAGLAAPAIAAPTRSLFRGQSNLTTLLAEVVAIDAPGQQVRLSDGTSLLFDHLILAAGATHSYFGHDGWEQHAPGLKTLEDAFEIRRRVLFAFESAEKEPDPERRKVWLTLCVVGAGPTGVEMAGAFAEIARQTLVGEFRRIDPHQARILLIEGGPRVLQAMPEELSAKALTQLQKLGVEVRLNSIVTSLDNNGLQVRGPAPAGVAGDVAYQIASKCVVWAAGVAASPLGKQLSLSTGCEIDRAGRVVVEPDLSVRGFPNISVIGDLAAALSHGPDKKPTPVPGVSPGAKQMGRVAARNVLRRIAAQATEAFCYKDHGNLATIGHNAAVVDLSTPLGALRFSGRWAWWFWLLAHIYFLIGFRNRLVVMLDWGAAYLSFSRNARVVAGTLQPHSHVGES